jgi:homoserine kinase
MGPHNPPAVVLEDLRIDSARLRVRVPGSTSNLGPGFDCLGLALSIWLEVEVLGETHAPTRFETLEDEAQEWPRGADNLVLRGFQRAWRELGGGERSFALRARSAIPVGRGIGSSGAAIAAGLLLGGALAPRTVGREQLLTWALDIEGHPDNVTVALVGGCSISVPRDGGPPIRVAITPHPSLGFALAWPRTRLETPVARGVLPAQVPFADAVENARRLALLRAGLERGDPELLALGGEDRLHVPYRLPLIAGAREALDSARECGAWLATISGAGSGLIALGERSRMRSIAEAMCRELTLKQREASAQLVEPVFEPPRPEPA